MRLCIIPMKPLARAKERLADVFSPDERRALSLAMLTDVIDAARALDEVWVLNSDDDAAAIAAQQGVRSEPDPTPDEGLNASLAGATATAIERGARGVLILSADCAAALPDDVRALAIGRGIALAPDRFGLGTNALWRMPPDCIPPAYGGKSRRSHEALAHVNGIPLAIVPRERLAVDVDSPADLDRLCELGPGEATRAVLETLGYPSRRR